MNVVGTLSSAVHPPPRLRELSVLANNLIGALPDLVGSAAQLERVTFSMNSLTGPVPDAMMSLSYLSAVNCNFNRLQGDLPHGFGLLRRLEFLLMGQNELQGGIACLTKVPRQLEVFDNGFTGAVPGSMPRLKLLRGWTNKLRGKLPPGMVSARGLNGLYLGSNDLTGPIPEALVSLWSLDFLELSRNSLRGAIPPLPQRSLFLQGNGLIGSLPGRLLAGKQIFIMLAGNHLEGTFPRGKVALDAVICFDVAGGAFRTPSKLQGTLPVGLARAQGMSTLLAHGHALEGHIPHFTSTFELLGLHDNAFETLPMLQLQPLRLQSPIPWLRSYGASLMVHRNRLSCNLPDHGDVATNLSLVAIGNSLFRPRVFPAWVQPFERVSLLWESNVEGGTFLVKLLAANFILTAVVLHMKWWKKQAFSAFSYLRILRFSMDLALALHQLLSHLVRHCILSVPLLLFSLRSFSVVCPSSLAIFSTCLSRSSTAQSYALMLWARTCRVACTPWWLAFKFGGHREAYRWRQLCAWSCWLLVLSSLSSVVVLQCVAQCVPKFFNIEEALLNMLNLCLGAFQAALSGYVIPRLARAFENQLPPEPLVGVGKLLMTCVLPCSSILTLHDSCMAHWTRWWRPCVRHTSGFHYIYLNFGIRTDVVHERVHDIGICLKSRSWSVPTCMRSMVVKLQNIVLGKLVALAVLSPAGRLLQGKPMDKPRDVHMSLAMHLEIAIFFGALLPLVSLLLLVGVATTLLLVAAAVKEPQGIERHAEAGACTLGITLALLCSAILQAGFVFGDIYGMICMGFALLLMLIRLRPLLFSRLSLSRRRRRLGLVLKE